MIGLASILVLGIGAQWLAWRLKVPSILLLLLVGCAAGPLAPFLFGRRLLDPSALLGDALLPFVSMAVAVILFEGGLTLRLRDLRGAGGAIRNLVLLGVPVTFGLTTLAARLALGWGWGLAALIGAIAIVTGPTVILPLLRHVRPTGAVGRVVRWEGILTDPVGAIAAVLVFEVLIGAEHAGGPIGGILRALAIGGGSGALAALLLARLLRRDLLPDFLHSPVALALAIGVYTLSNLAQEESGLLSVTVMGILLANQRRVSIEHIARFKEDLSVLLVSSLFVLLAARLSPEDLRAIDPRTLLFVALLVLVVRPATAALALARTELNLEERAFVAWMAPRGIVAAAVSSVFALELSERGVAHAGELVPVVFALIVGTVAVYGLTSAPLARRLGLSRGRPGGVLIAGANAIARAIGVALKAEGAEVLLVDTNYNDSMRARMEGLAVWNGSVLAEDLELRAPLDGLGKLVALTPNDGVNALACIHLAPIFGRGGTYQLAPSRLSSRSTDGELPLDLRGRRLFSGEIDFWELQRRLRDGHRVKRSNVGEEFGLADFHRVYDRPDAPALPLFVVDPGGRVEVVAEGERPRAQPGDTIVALVAPEAVEPERPANGAALASNEPAGPPAGA